MQLAVADLDEVGEAPDDHEDLRDGVPIADGRDGTGEVGGAAHKADGVEESERAQDDAAWRR